jgi:hypothetical protein
VLIDDAPLEPNARLSGIFRASRIEPNNRVVVGTVKYSSLEAAEEALRHRFPECIVDISEEYITTGRGRDRLAAIRPPRGEWIRWPTNQPQIYQGYAEWLAWFKERASKAAAS